MPVMRIAFLDVGQGDTTVISCPETQEAIIVDCINSLAVIDYLKRENIKQLRGVIITHLHADHYDQVANLLDNCSRILGIQDCEILATSEAVVNPADLHKESVRKKWPPDGDGHSVVCEQPPLVGKKRLPPTSLARLYQWCKTNREKCKPLFAHTEMPIQGTLVKNIQILHPPFVDYQKLKMNGLNNISVVLRVTGTNSHALLMGDIEPYGWQYLKESFPDLRSDVLKFPHHGGTWEEVKADDLISTVEPSIVVISVGSNNSFDHPRSDVFTSLSKQEKVCVLCTEATDKCKQTLKEERDSIIRGFQIQSSEDNSFFIKPKPEQCPCAGTIILDLADKPIVLQPTPNFHESIINVHLQQHKCRLQ